MSLPGRLIGRDAVLAAAGSVLRGAQSGTGQFLMISGEAGIGKTSVLAALINQAGPDWVVLRGSCWEGQGAPPYWPWSQVLRTTGLSTAELGEAGRLLETGAASARPMTAAAAADAQFRLFEAVCGCLSGLAAEQPVLVVLDDLHWSDESSLRLLRFLVRALATSRVMFLAAYRDTEAQPELLELAGSAEHQTLAGLGPSDVAELVQALTTLQPSVQISEQLWNRSGGNPFFVRELTRLLVAQGSWQEQAQIPASVAETLRRRLARLSTPCVRMLDWAAVAGRDVDVGLLAHAGAASGEAEALELLDEAKRAKVIVGNGDEAVFAHDLYRETILGGLSPSTKADINLSVGRSLLDRHGNTARVASHFVAAGTRARQEAVAYSILAAREATARLGHEDACGHYQRALHLLDSRTQTGEPVPDRIEVLLELAAAQDRAGLTAQARQQYLVVADAARHGAGSVTLAKAALGVQSLGHRSGAQQTQALDLLSEAAQQLEATSGPLALQSQVLAAQARAMRHGSQGLPDAAVIRTAHRAVELATTAGEPHALTVAKLAEHDSMWRPGTAHQRLPVIMAMLEAATSCGEDDLVAEAHLLRAAALLELGDPAGRDELLTYIRLAGELGHARGRWGALTRQATFAQLAGQAGQAARLGAQALELGLAIGEPDAVGCFFTARLSLVALGVPEPEAAMDSADPLWPMFPILQAWPLAARGEIDAAATALGDFSVLDISVWTGLEGLAAAAVVFAAVGSDAQRSWTYEQLLPHAGTHVVVGGCASYHAAVDHHLGALAASIGDTSRAEEHFRAALSMHERLGAAGWARLSEQALIKLGTVRAAGTANEFRLVNGLWQLEYETRKVLLPDSKGLRDLARLISAQGADVHVFTLLGREFPPTGADPVLDETARKRFKARLDLLAEEIADAEECGDANRSQKVGAERDSLIHELAASVGLGGRSRRLGDQSERARKTVSARVRDALSKIDHVHPNLAQHLREALQMGTVCAYTPKQPTTWKLGQHKQA